MAHKTLTISEEAYDALARIKGKDESFTKVILRLAKRRGSGDLLDFPVYSTERRTSLSNRGGLREEKIHPDPGKRAISCSGGFQATKGARRENRAPLGVAQ
jgi:predicted CopG family antitoxin